MDELKTKLENMRDRLARYYSDPEFRSAEKLYDIEGKTTRFYCGLLNVILGTRLIATDPLGDWYSYLDLIDWDGKTAAVVTPCARQEKLDKILAKLNKLKEEEQEEQVEHLVFLSTEMDPRIESVQPAEVLNVEIWSFDYLVQRAEAVPEEGRKYLWEYLDDWLQNNPPTYLLEALPAPCDHFVPGSRDPELAKLMEKLEKGKQVFVTGVGGIGKTQTVIQFALRAAPRRGAYLVRFKEPDDAAADPLRATILNANFLGYRFTGEDNEAKDLEYEARMKILRDQYAGAMLVLDNLDWEPHTLDEICCGTTYEELTAMDLQLVITSRSTAEKYPNVPIKGLNEKDCLTLLELTMGEEEYAEYKEEKLLDLIHKVANHTLTIYLIGNLLSNGWWTGVTPETLMNKLDEQGLLALDELPMVVTDKDQTYAERTIYGHIRVLFNISGMTPADCAVMRTMALIPGGSISERLFVRGLSENKENTALESLIDRGWIQREKYIANQDEESTRLKLLPMIRKLCIDELKPTGDSCRKFLQRLRANNDPDILMDREDIEQLAKVFSEASDREDPDGRWARVAARYWTEHGDDKKANKYLQRAVDRSGSITDPEHVLVAYQQLANGEYNKRDPEKAMETMRIALEYQDRSSVDELRQAYTYTTLGNLYGSQGGYQEQALRCHELALDFAKKALQNQSGKAIEDKINADLARAYTNVGLSLYALNDDTRLGEALENLKKARNILRKHLPKQHPNLAQIHNHIGMVYDKQGKHNRALLHRNAALAICEEKLPEDHPELARAYISMGNNLYNLQDYSEALSYQLRGLAIREQAMQEDQLGLAAAYVNISATYRAIGDHQSALEYQLKACTIREAHLPVDDVKIGYCYRDMAISYRKLGQKKREKECLEKAYEILDLYPDEQVQRLKRAIAKRRESMA